MHDRQALRGSGEGDVERAQALRFLVDDARRLDHHRSVELQSLHQADRHDRDLVVEALLDRSTVFDAGGRQRVAQAVGQ